MRSVLAIFGIYVLALLLAGTFPVGAGDAVHGGALLHPAFPHTHTPAGEAAPNPAPQRAQKPTLAPTLDASAGGLTEVPSTGLTPSIPRPALAVVLLDAERLRPADHPRPAQRLEPPPDPPPPTSSVQA